MIDFRIWLSMGGGDGLEEEMREISRVTEMFCVLIGVLIKWLYLFGNTC